MTQIQINALKDLQSMLERTIWRFGINNFSVNLQVLKRSKLSLNRAEEKIEVQFMGYRAQ